MLLAVGFEANRQRFFFILQRLVMFTQSIKTKTNVIMQMCEQSLILVGGFFI